MQNKCDLAQEMYETIIETPNVPNNIRANAYKQLGKCAYTFDLINAFTAHSDHNQIFVWVV